MGVGAPCSNTVVQSRDFEIVIMKHTSLKLVFLTGFA
jgi:hypothetical protein